MNEIKTVVLDTYVKDDWFTINELCVEKPKTKLLEIVIVFQKNSVIDVLKMSAFVL